MELNDISISEDKQGEETVIIKPNTVENKIEENAYVNTSLVVDTIVLNKRESHVYDHLQRSHDTASNCKEGCITRFKQYKDCIMLSLIGVLFIAVTVLAIFIGLPEKSGEKGSWNEWEAWGDCSATCSYGMERRERICSISSGIQCYGDSIEYRICKKMVCPDQSVPGGWSVWGLWSECSMSCSTELTSRNRSCSNPKPSNGSYHCLGDSTEYKLCDRSSCSALNGGWSAWSAWGNCSGTCGTGLQRRNRICSNPPQDLHGIPCVGDFTDYQLCAIACDERRNCKILKDKGDTTTGFKTIVPDGINPIRVLCIMDVEQGGWTVIQKRESATDFYKKWTEYRNGFGEDTNFWLGLENIHRLTAQGNHELRIDMMKTNNQRAAAKYQIFSVGDETMLYKLSIGNYSFDPAFTEPGNALFYHNGMNFSTYDNDNDLAYNHNCAVLMKGGYWYNNCIYSNLNGLYGITATGQGIHWHHYTGYSESLKFTRMMIRPN